MGQLKQCAEETVGGQFEKKNGCLGKELYPQMISGTNMIKYTSTKKPKIMHTSKFHRTKKKLLELEKLKH